MTQNNLLALVRDFNKEYETKLDLTARRDRILLYLTNTRSKVFSIKKKPNHSACNFGYYRDGILYRVYGWGQVYDDVLGKQPKVLNPYMFTIAKMILPADAIELVKALCTLHGSSNAPRMGWNPRNLSNMVDYDNVPFEPKVTVIPPAPTKDQKLMDKVLEHIKQPVSGYDNPVDDDPFATLCLNTSYDIYDAVKRWVKKYFKDNEQSDALLAYLFDVVLENDFDIVYEEGERVVDLLLDQWIEENGCAYDFVDDDIPDTLGTTQEDEDDEAIRRWQDSLFPTIN